MFVLCFFLAPVVEEERASQPITRRDDGLYYCNHCDFRSDRRFGVQKHIKGTIRLLFLLLISKCCMLYFSGYFFSKGLHELSAKCTYAGCGLEFLNLKLLMVHIKEEHRKKIVVEKLPEMETETTSLPEKNPEPKVVIEAPARNDGTREKWRKIRPLKLFILHKNFVCFVFRWFRSRGRGGWWGQ